MKFVDWPLSAVAITAARPAGSNPDSRADEISAATLACCSLLSVCSCCAPPSKGYGRIAARSASEAFESGAPVDGWDSDGGGAFGCALAPSWNFFNHGIGSTPCPAIHPPGYIPKWR